MKSVFAITVFLIFLGSQAQANVGPLHISDKGIMIVNSENISMESEKISVVLSVWSAEVTCDFIMKNEGPETAVNMTFPESEEREISNLEAFVDGKQQQVLYEDRPEDYYFPGLHYWKTSLPLGKPIRVQVRYTVKSNSGGNVNGKFHYILGTGKFWKGRIKDARITVSFDKIDITHVSDFSPRNGNVNVDGTITWHFKDFEPEITDGITIWYDFGRYSMFYDHWVGDTKAADEKLKEPESISLLKNGKYDEFVQLIERLALENTHHMEGEQVEQRALRYTRGAIVDRVEPVIASIGLDFEERENWTRALEYYEYWDKTLYYGQGSYVTGSFRLARARCHARLGNQKQAIALYKESMRTEDEQVISRCAEYHFRDNGDPPPPVGSKALKSEMHYCRNKGINEFCRANIRALGGE